MKTYQSIQFTVENDIAVIRLNRPDRMNALSTEMRAEIMDAARSAPRQARVLVLTGEGRAFSAGQDLNDGRMGASVDMERVLRDEYVPMIEAVSNCPIPTISAVNGPAAGAGANLALAADVVIAAESAYFLQAFARIGLIPDAGGTYWLPRQMGAAKAMGAALFADPISARQADAWGMIWEAVERGTFRTALWPFWKSAKRHLKAAKPTR